MTKPEPKSTALAAVPAWTREQVDLIRRTIAKGATDDELQLFLGLCRRTGLDPFARQIYAIKRWDSREKREVMQPQASIDGLRLIADRSGKYEGQEGPFWCDDDGLWRDVWTDSGPPAAAKVGVLKTGFRGPIWGVARFHEYVQTDRSGAVNAMWSKMAANQLAKCAESLALRKAFPQELSGVYGADELDHTENGTPPAIAASDMQKPWTTFRGMIDEFAKLHARLGPANDHLYQQILRQHGAEHSNQFKNAGIAVAAYSALLDCVEEIEKQAASGEDIPPEAL